MADVLVGDSIQKPMEPTNVPGGSNVSTEAVAPALEGFEDVQPEPSVHQALSQVAPTLSSPQASDPISDEFEDVSPEDNINMEDVPDYADGLSSSTPINKSPVDLADRLRLAAGNKVGKLKYLKAKFEDANLDKKGNLQVKKEGLWYNVDPSGLGDGDAWSRTKEIVGDTADLADIAASVIGGTIGAGKGAMLGAAVGGPPGALAGSVIGAGIGGGAAEGIRSSLGRLAGTYEATPEEQLKDIGIEAALALGGQTVALGAKPTIKMAWDAFKNTGASASNYGKEVLSAAYAGLTNQPRWAFRRAMDNADNVISKSSKALQELGPSRSPLEAVDIIKSKQNRLLGELASESDTQLKSNYRRNLGNLVASTPDNFSFAPAEPVQQAMTDLAEQGFGKLVKNGERTSFRLIDDAELATLLGTSQDQLPKILGPRTKESLAQVGDILNQYARFPALTGKQGAAKTVELKRAIRESLDDITSSDAAPPQIKSIVGKVLNTVEQKIGQSFSNSGIADNYITMNKEYSKFADVTKLLKKAVDSKNPAEVDNLVQRLVSKAGSHRQLKDEAKDLGELLGMDKVQELVDWEASKSFLDFVPKANSAEGLFSSAIKAVIGSTVASPRSSGATIKYANKTLDFLRKLPPKQLVELLKDDKRLAEALSLGGQLGAQEAQQVNELLNQAGMKQPGEQ